MRLNTPIIKIITALLLPVLILLSCKRNNKALILGKWRSVKIENHDKDLFFISSQQFIDTIGKGNSDATNLELYGVTNTDSLRKELQAQYDSAYAAQMSIDTQSIFSFNEDSTIKFVFPGKSEIGRWYIDESGYLVLDEINDDGQVEHLVVEITDIGKVYMKLTFIRALEEGLSDTSIVTFHRE